MYCVLPTHAYTCNRTLLRAMQLSGNCSRKSKTNSRIIHLHNGGTKKCGVNSLVPTSTLCFNLCSSTFLAFRTLLRHKEEEKRGNFCISPMRSKKRRSKICLASFFPPPKKTTCQKWLLVTVFRTHRLLMHYLVILPTTYSGYHLAAQLCRSSRTFRRPRSSASRRAGSSSSS